MIPTVNIKQVTYFSDLDLENMIIILSNSNTVEIKYVIYFEENGKEVYLTLHGSTKESMYFKPCDTNKVNIACIISAKHIDTFGDSASELCIFTKTDPMKENVDLLKRTISDIMMMRSIDDIKNSIKGSFDIVFDGSKFINDLSEKESFNYKGVEYICTC